jgi:hypothetical protein
VPRKQCVLSGQRTHRGQLSGGHEAYGQLLVPTDHQTVHPSRLPLRINADVTRSSKQNAEYIPRFNTSKGRPNTVMDASTECHMSPWCLSSQINGLGVIEHWGVTVGRTPQQKNCRPGWYLHTTEFGALGMWRM